MPELTPPQSEEELLERATLLAGQRLGELAQRAGRQVPAELRRAKGFVGQLLEQLLGATAKSRAAPDFEQLGVELKTIPVDYLGSPVESTFVCTIPLLNVGRVEWGDCRVRKKLARVLWIPVLGVRTVPVAERLIGSPLLWSPSPEDEADLRWDWEELAGIIGRGGVDEVTGHMGKLLQVRPKAANAQSRRRALGEEGVAVDVLPRGFYLRATFTARILQRHYLLPSGHRG